MADTLRPGTSRAGGRSLLEVAGRLTGSVQAIRSDPVLRRRLRYRPDEGLSALGYDIVADPAPLPVNAQGWACLPELVITADTLMPAASAPAHQALVEGLPEPWPLELRLVRYGAKPMALLHGPAAQMAALGMACHRLGLAGLLSPWRFEPESDARSGGYVNIAGRRRLAGPEPAGWQGLLVSRSSAAVELGWLSLMFGWDALLGRLLGYPACCADAFGALWQAACRDYGGEPARVLLARAGDVVVRSEHPTMNLPARHLGIHATEHFPCSFTCPAAIRAGDAVLDAWARFEPKQAGETRALLQAPTLCLAEGGTVVFAGSHWDGPRRCLDIDHAGMRHAGLSAAMAGRLAGANRLGAGRDTLLLEAPGLESNPLAGWLMLFDDPLSVSVAA